MSRSLREQNILQAIRGGWAVSMLRSMIAFLVLVSAFFALPSSAESQVTIVAREHWTTGVSAADSSPLKLYLYEKHDKALDPNAQAARGRIVLVVHGATTSGRVNYDVQVPGVPLEQSFSLMDQFARRGYDVWTLDYQNYGRSDHHDCGLCVTTDAAARDIEAAVKFILGQRGVRQLHLIGWSWGAQTAALFASRRPHQVNRLVLYAPVLDLQGPPPPTTHFRTNNEAALSGFYHPTARVPEAIAAYVKAALEVDGKSPNAILMDWRTNPAQADPRKLTMPTLVIYGADDDRTPVSGPNVYPFFRDLTTKDKKFVVIPNAGHGLYMEQQRWRWYEEVLLHLEKGAQ